MLAFVAGGIVQPFQYLSVSAQPGCQTFKETGKAICGRFLEYWQKNGGLAQQGLPLSGEFAEVSPLNGQTYTVQYFERAVFEKHPENAPPFDVLLSQLGTFQFKAIYPKGEPVAGQPTQVPVPTQPLVFSGRGTLKTAPLTLSGDYVVGWTVKVPTGRGSCVHYLRLTGINISGFFGENVSGTASVVEDDPLTQAGQTRVYGLKAGQYYVDANSTCGDWSVTFKRP